MRTAILALLLTGCTSSYHGWCAIVQAAHTDGGVPVIRVECEEVVR